MGKLIKINRSWLYQKYIVEKLSTYKIAKLCSCSSTTIANKLNEFNILIRSTNVKENNGKWQGGKYLTGKGYIRVKEYNHPFTASYSYILEHRLVIERYLREMCPNHPALIEINGEKYLNPKWIVHHKGTRYPLGSIENKQDNKIDNLGIYKSSGLHTKYHHSIRRY